MAFRNGEVRQPGRYDVYEASVSSGLACRDESLAVQSDALDADINTIVKRFGLTGTLPSRIDFPSMEEFADVFDFQSAMNVITEGNKAFMALPADIRGRFLNDPQRFLEFCIATDGDGVLTNLEEMRKMGLAVPKLVPESEVKPDAKVEPK